MTGFAAVRREAPGETVHVTVKSVNHRFLDLAIKAPSSLASLESRLRASVQQRVARGRIEVTVVVDTTAPPDREVVLDERLLSRVAAAIDAARVRGVVTGGLTASDILQIPHAVEIRPSSGVGAPPSGDLASLVVGAVEDGMDALVVMRETEGRFIQADLVERLGAFQGFVDALDVESRAGQQRLEVRLRERIDALPSDVGGDPAAFAREIVRFVSRSDVDEEIVRLRSHVDHWRRLAEGAEPCGRQLDFLVQEMHREVNTVGSKVESARASEVVIAAKAELERIREQVQNVE
jgi:uncharacterized protein (TIGR00255 family)